MNRMGSKNGTMLLSLLFLPVMASCVGSAPASAEEEALDGIDGIEAVDEVADEVADDVVDDVVDDDVVEDGAFADVEKGEVKGARGEVVRLVAAKGVSGNQRVNFAIPLAPGELFDASLVRVRRGGRDLPLSRRALASYPDGSLRSVQIQVDWQVGASPELEVILGEATSAGSLARVPVEQTLVTPNGTEGPRVFALLSPERLSASGVVGPIATSDEIAGTPYDGAWSKVCNYDKFGLQAFLPKQGEASLWLYDRGTVFQRAHAMRGDEATLRAAYIETALYRAKLGPNGETGVPGKTKDPKYHYAQNLAVHYLMTGDDRFREAAEAVADRLRSIWRLQYKGKDTGLWTERHAGFSLLAFTSAAMVSDDKAAHFQALADEAVDAFLDVQATYPVGYTDPDARCFAHHAGAHGEGYGYFGCSPWMSAILADGLDMYARERGGVRADKVRTSIVRLGRAIARDGLDKTGKPFYWMGVGTNHDEVDWDDEHFGESAYVIAMAYHHDGAHDVVLKGVVEGLVANLAKRGRAPHLRSFNWQCRSAVATPAYMGLAAGGPLSPTSTPIRKTP